MDSVAKEVDGVSITTEKKNVCSDKITGFIEVLSKMISEYYVNQKEEQE